MLKAAEKEACEEERLLTKRVLGAANSPGNDSLCKCEIKANPDK